MDVRVTVGAVHRALAEIDGNARATAHEIAERLAWRVMQTSVGQDCSLLWRVREVVVPSLVDQVWLVRFERQQEVTHDVSQTTTTWNMGDEVVAARARERFASPRLHSSLYQAAVELAQEGILTQRLPAQHRWVMMQVRHDDRLGMWQVEFEPSGDEGASPVDVAARFREAALRGDPRLHASQTRSCSVYVDGHLTNVLLDVANGLLEIPEGLAQTIADMGDRVFIDTRLPLEGELTAFQDHDNGPIHRWIESKIAVEFVVSWQHSLRTNQGIEASAMEAAKWGLRDWIGWPVRVFNVVATDEGMAYIVRWLPSMEDTVAAISQRKSKTPRHRLTRPDILSDEVTDLETEE